MIRFRGAGGLTILIGAAACFFEFMSGGIGLWFLLAAAINGALGWVVNKKYREAGVPEQQHHGVGDIPIEHISVGFLLLALAIWVLRGIGWIFK